MSCLKIKQLGILMVFVAICWVPSWPRLHAGDPVRLRILSYNIHHGEGTDGRIDLDRIADIIRGTKPDLVALQECDRNTRRSGGVDQPAELGKRTAMDVLFGHTIDFDGGQYGNAVLARRKPLRSTYHRLPQLVEGEMRGMLDVAFDIAEGGPRIRFLATHLDHRSNDGERMASAETIEKLVKEQPEMPMILAGDLNAGWDSRVIDRFRAHWVLANQKPLFTSPAGDPKRQIDYILFRPSDRWRTISASVVPAPDASDHRPLVVELEWNGLYHMHMIPR